MAIKDDLLEILHLVEDVFRVAGMADRVESINDLIGVGEWELAYTDLCTNIQEFEIPVPPHAYALFVKLWPEVYQEAQRWEGADWSYMNALGERPGYPTKADALARAKSETLRKQEQQELEIDERRQRVYPWNAEPTGVSKPGKVEVHANWTLTEPVMALFNQLVQLGVYIYSSSEGKDYTFMVPHGLFPEQYKEVERLMAVIAQEIHSQVDYIDWYPHGHKLRIYFPKG